MRNANRVSLIHTLGPTRAEEDLTAVRGVEGGYCYYRSYHYSLLAGMIIDIYIYDCNWLGNDGLNWLLLGHFISSSSSSTWAWSMTNNKPHHQASPQQTMMMMIFLILVDEERQTFFMTSGRSCHEGIYGSKSHTLDGGTKGPSMASTSKQEVYPIRDTLLLWLTRIARLG